VSELTFKMLKLQDITFN